MALRPSLGLSASGKCPWCVTPPPCGEVDPMESCMVAARVADHSIDPNAIGELWTRRGAHESCVWCQPHPAARQLID